MRAGESSFGLLQFERSLFVGQLVRFLHAGTESDNPPADCRRSGSSTAISSTAAATTEPIIFQQSRRACGSACAHHAAVVDPLDVENKYLRWRRGARTRSPHRGATAIRARLFWFSNSLSNAVASVAILARP